MKKAAFFLAVFLFALCGCHGETDDAPVWYEIADGEAIITGDCGKAVIPAYVEGCPVTRIGELAFYENTTCAEIVLPETLKSIDGNAFYRCSALREITIPASVCTIGTNPFFRANSLKNIWVEEGNPNYCDVEGVLFSADGSTLLAYPEARGDTQYTVPDGTIAIADSAFGYHTALRYIQIPDSVVSFPDCNIFAFPDEITIVASENSAASAYAAKHGIHWLTDIPNIIPEK